MSAIILVTGGFDPIHSGHIAYFKDAKEFNPSVPLCVGLNSDEWLIRKKGKYFLPMTERRAIVKELKPVDLTITYDDTDNSTNMAIYKCLQMYDRVIFCNGGDRVNTNVPEYLKFQEDERVIFEWGVGGDDKMNSSSWILNEFLKR